MSRCRQTAAHICLQNFCTVQTYHPPNCVMHSEGPRGKPHPRGPFSFACVGPYFLIDSERTPFSRMLPSVIATGIPQTQSDASTGKTSRLRPSPDLVRHRPKYEKCLRHKAF